MRPTAEKRVPMTSQNNIDPDYINTVSNYAKTFFKISIFVVTFLDDWVEKFWEMNFKIRYFP